MIAVNPFQRLPHLYDVHMMEQYKGATFGELSPHLFAIADACYRSVCSLLAVTEVDLLKFDQRFSLLVITISGH